MRLQFYQTLIVSVCVILGHPMTAAGGVTYSSADAQVSLMEVYVSEGCSSCPPAQKWVSNLADDPRLWTEIVPVVFHVNYWDYLGWKDPFASKMYTERQYQHKTEGRINSVYTPGFVVNGREWRGWFAHEDLPASGAHQGWLNAFLHFDELKVSYQGTVTEPVLNVAILGFGIDSHIKRGENRGLTLREDFVVLVHKTYVSKDGQWSVLFPRYVMQNAKRYALAVWVNAKGNATPLQATGGWIPEETTTQ